MLAVLYDGWSFAYAPCSPAGLHLATLLAYRPEAVRAYVALPAEPPFSLPEDIAYRLAPAPPGPAGRLRWEQRILPRLAKELQVSCIHLISSGPALFDRTPALVSPAHGMPGDELNLDALFSTGPAQGRGLAARLREALAFGGFAHLGGLIWPADLPVPRGDVPILQVEPVVHPAFFGAGEGGAELLHSLDLPAAYVLYAGPSDLAALQRLLQAWTWAAGPIGEATPLLLAGLDPSARARLPELLQKYQVEASVQALPDLPPQGLAALFAGCAAVFHPAPVSPWDGPVRLGLAAGRPVVTVETPVSDAMVGPAAYLVPGKEEDPGFHRSLGAAVITVVVEESVAQTLEKAARKRAAAYLGDRFSTQLLQAYRQLSPG